MTGITYNVPAPIINANTPDLSQSTNPNQNIVIGTVDDTAGAFTNAQLNSAFPNAVASREVTGVNRVYQYNGSTWFYISKTNCN